MKVRQRFALLIVAASAALLAACIPPETGGGSTTTTTTSTSTTTTTVLDDPNGRYVATTGSDAANDCAASATPCATIQHAVGQAAAGNTVYVAAGTYAELVSVDKDLAFRGANSGIPAGVDAGTRGPESVVKGFRSLDAASTTRDVTVDGFEIDPQDDAALIAASAQALVLLRGGTTNVSNNVFDGGAFVANCTFNCPTMPDYAYHVLGGAAIFADNTVTNFRRPININQNAAGVPTNAVVEGNLVTGATSRAMAVGGSTGVQMPGVTVADNVVDSTGFVSPSSPAGITISNAGNTVSGNTFKGLGAGVYIDICKKFVMNDNAITGNTFESNGYGVNINVNSDGGQCVSSPTEGTGGWVPGGGELDGLEVTGNNFVGNTTAAIRDGSYNWGFWNPTAPTETAGPIDATCNWWNSPGGPSTTFHTYGGTLTPVADQLVTANGPGTQADWNYVPWLTAPAPGGACNGTPI